MGAKKPRVDPTTWLKNIIDILVANARCLPLSALYDMTRTTPTVQTESLITEHPSLRVFEQRVYFEPFANVGDQMSLYKVLRAHFPYCYRRIDLYGLYPFVMSDFDDLVFRRLVTVLDVQQQTITVQTHPEGAWDNMRRLWMESYPFVREL